MSESSQRGGGARLVLIAGDPWCTFCGRPDASPIHGMPKVAVCEDCLRTACRDVLREMRR